MLLLWAVQFALSSVLAREVYLEEDFNGATSLDDWIVPNSSDVTLGKLVLSKYKYSNDSSNMGIKTSEDARFYWASKRFAKPATTKGKEFVVQFSVAFEQEIDCGGGYIKLYSSQTDQGILNDKTPYFIMFGPDICGPSKRVTQAILNYKGNNLEMRTKLNCKDDVFTHVYTLILKPDKTFVVKTDNKEKKAGKLEDEWDFLPPKKIKDPKATKPADWDDREFIDDEDDKKPDDWDQPQFIQDKKAVKPSDWNDEEDGKWEPPMVENPDYKGEWKPKSKKNPNYKGAWQHPLIDNPDYKSDESVGLYEDIGVLGIDVWQVKSGTIFDNFLITDDAAYAEERAKEIIANARIEKEIKEKQEEEKRGRGHKSDKEDDEDADEETDKVTSNDDDLIDDDETENDEEDDHSTGKPKTSAKPDTHDHEEL